ncbi:MAG: translation initiation factor 2 [Pseudomonadota bacterium]|nr:translation initiation factor 2 [Pseudomonadota bacterium]
MAEERPTPSPADEDAILQQQFRRALSSFEGIILSQIDIKNKLGDRLNYSIQTGIIILGVIALSILVLLLTLSAQITRISGVVAEMNIRFTSVSTQMHEIKDHMGAMEQRVALLEQIEQKTAIMDREMGAIGADMDLMQRIVSGIDAHVGVVRNSVGNIAVNIDLMNLEVQSMSTEMLRVSRPARTINKMFPFP